MQAVKGNEGVATLSKGGRCAWRRAAACGLLLLGACARSPTATRPSPSPSPSPARTTPSTSPSTQAGIETGTLAVADANDGQTVTLHVGNHLRVVLASTYWKFEPETAASVLRPEGSPTTSPSPGCVPGAGCGTAAAVFTALSPGHATIVATRTSCGEAMLCRGAAGHYQIEVVVAS